MILLAICEILGRFVNTFTADDKYVFIIVRIWRDPFKCNYLKNKQKISKFLPPFLKSAINLETFWKKDDPHSLSISKITDWERLRLTNV